VGPDAATQLGRQEIHAEVLDSEEGGIVSRSWWQLWQHNLPLPPLETVIMSLDTAFTEDSRMKVDTRDG
jgi:phage terminase large subunit-like protein